MKINRTPLLLMVFALLAVSAACGFNVSTAKIDTASTARDVNDAKENTKIFGQDEVFYALVALKNAPDDTVTKAVWYAVKAEGIDANTKIDEAEFTGSEDITFDLSNNGPWPVGTYKVELYLNDKLAQTLDFSVESTAVESPAAATGSTAGGVTITDAYTVRYTSGENFEKTSVYGVDEDFYCDVELSDYTQGNTVKIDWVAVNAEGIDPNAIIFTAEGSSTGNALEFQLSNDQSWPTGEYTAEISLDGVYQGRVDFTVE